MILSVVLRSIAACRAVFKQGGGRGTTAAQQYFRCIAAELWMLSEF